MATYRNGHKRGNSDNFLKYMIIGFSITFFVVIIGMILFSIFDNSLDYDSFDTIGDYSQISFQEEDEYLVYWYSETCPACSVIKQTLLDFADSNEAGIKVYFMDAAKTTGTNYIPQMTATPSMLVVVDGSIVDLLGGNVQIPEVLDSINEGTYVPLN